MTDEHSRRLLAALRQQREAAGEALPDGWTPGQEMRQSFADDDRATQRGSEIVAHAPPAVIRRRAVLTFRCDDCGGMPFAYVTYVDRRPCLWARPHRREDAQEWEARFLDGVHWGASEAHCRGRTWSLAPEFVLSKTPAVGSSRDTPTLRLKHNA